MNEQACSIITSGGHHTDIVVKSYSNRALLIVTHFKKFGTVLSINRESSINGYTSDVFSIKTLFGSDNNDIYLAARYIVEQIDIKTPLLLSISLKDYSVETLKSVVDAINQIKSW